MIDEKVIKMFLSNKEFWNEKICPICGGHFFPPSDEWAYKRGELLFCSWHCLCAFDRLPGTDRVSRFSTAERRQYRLRLTRDEKNERNKKVADEYDNGDSAYIIANRYDITPDHVRRIVRLMKDGTSGTQRLRKAKPDTSRKTGKAL